MKKILIFIFTFFISVLLLAQSDVRSELVYKKYTYSNGKLASEGYLKDNKPEGFWKSYYQTGVVKSEGKWKNNKLDSVWIFFDQLGDTIEKINYYSGKKNGYHYRYFKEKHKNKIYSTELYVNDKRHNNAYVFYNTGNVKKVIPFKNNKRHGLGFEYDTHGGIISIFRYRNNEIIVAEQVNRYDSLKNRIGTWKEFYDNGILKEEKFYVEGKLDGYYKTYTSTGELEKAIKYKNGEIDIKSNDFNTDIDIKEEYDDDEHLIYQGSFKGTVPIGIHRYFNQEGKVIKSETYDIYGNIIERGIVLINGNRQGDNTAYYLNQKVKSQGKYNRGRKHGKWTYFYKNGKIQQIGSYINGRLTGVWKWYYETGELLREEYYIYNQLDGESVEYTVLGDIIAKGNYIEGLKEGAWIYSVGDHKFTGKYVMGNKNGKWLAHYLEEETLSFEGRYIQGNPDGKHSFYYPNGNIMEERYYSEGEKVKSWSKYDENGALILVVQYKYGEEYKINGVKIKEANTDN